MCGGGKAPSQDPTVADIASANVNAQMWDYYETNYQPLIAKYAQMTTDPGRQVEEKRQVAGQVNADVMKSVDPSKATANPAKNAKMISGLAGAESTAQVTGQGNVKTKQLGDIQSVINVGRGTAAEAQEGLSEVAGQSDATALANLQLDQQYKGATTNAVGSAVGGYAAFSTRTKTPKSVKTLSPTDSFDYQPGYDEGETV